MRKEFFHFLSRIRQKPRFARLKNTPTVAGDCAFVPRFYKKMETVMRAIGLLAIGVVLLVTERSATAGFLPFGIQSNVTQSAVNSWGWTEIHRSEMNSTVPIAPILSAATGQYLAMGVWDTAMNRYAILGAGATSVVTTAVYNDYLADTGVTLNNWSNGINFYRTSGNGSWGFTSNDRTELDQADIYLLNGSNTYFGANEGVNLSRGLSFHSNGPNLFAGWAFNLTGNDFTFAVNPMQRVFFTFDAAPAEVPEPASLTLFGLGALGLAGAARRRRQAA